MDPASAGVAFVGFAASITTLTALALESSKTLYNLRRRLQSTPEDVRRLIRQVQIFESLLQAIQRALQVNGDLGVPQDLQELWKGSTDLMREDMERFKLIVSRLQRLVDGPTVSSKMIKLRIRQIFDEETVKGFQERISSHIETLTLIQTTVNHRKLDAVSHNATRLTDVSSIAFQTICSKLDHAESSSCGRYKRYQESLDQMDDRLQLLQNQLELGPFRPSSSLVRPAIVGKWERAGDKTVAATISWTSRSYSLPIGTLHVQVRKKRKCSRSTESSVEESEQSSINLTFAPPRWLSSIMLRYSLELCRNYRSSLPGLTFNITPFTVNNNPLLFQAIREADVAGLRRLFQAGLARPTDHVLSLNRIHDPMSLLDYYCYALSDFSKSQCYDMYQFLLENCGPVTLGALPMAFWQPTRIPSHVKNYSYRSYVATFLAHGGQVLRVDKSLTVERSGFWLYLAIDESFLSILAEEDLSFDCIQDCLLRQVEPWIMEELGYIDVWYIGVLAHTDEAFRRAIKKYIDSYRSPFYASGRSTSNDSFESVFGIKSIVAQVKSALRTVRVQFLQTISFSGTHAMLKPFLDAGFDVNEGGLWKNYLGSAAANGRLETFHMLLDAGANAALALPAYLTRRDWSSVPTLEHSFSTLVESTFLNSGLLERRKLREIEGTSFLADWMHAIIQHDRSDMLDFLLRHGAGPNVQRRRSTGGRSVGLGTFKPWTVLKLAVECGNVTCVNLLVQYGAKIAHPDGSGITALQLAQANTACSLPRHFFLSGDRLLGSMRKVKAADDVEILAILERALEAQCESSAAIVMHPESKILDECVKSTSPATGIVLKFQGQVKNFLRGIITRTQAQHIRSVLRSGYYDPCQLSRLSFCDALLMRLVYVMSYCLLLLYEVTSIAIWLGELPRPPRALLPAVVLVMLAVIWGFYV